MRIFTRDDEHRSDPGFDSPELIRLVDDGYDIAGSVNPQRTFPLIQGIPSSIPPESVRYIHFWQWTPGLHQRLPKYFQGFVNLTGLSLPAPALQTIRPGDVPLDNLRSLSIRGGNCVIPDSLYFPRLERLWAMDECLFSVSNMPALWSLGVELDKRGRVAASIKALPSLIALSLGRIRDESIYEVVSDLGVEHLTISPLRTYHALRGIEKVKTLRTLYVVSFTMVKSLEPLSLLPLLEEIFFNGCKKLPTLTPLLDCPRLTGVRFLDCGRLDWEGAREILLSRPVEIDDAFT